jgi:hypothetical protein
VRSSAMMEIYEDSKIFNIIESMILKLKNSFNYVFIRKKVGASNCHTKLMRG